MGILAYYAVLMGWTGLVVAAGIRAGIERLTSWGVPLLFVLLLALAIWASFLPGAQEGYQGFLLRWDPSKLIDPTTIRNAFTQAFFSIGAGIGCILAYAAYLDQRSALPREAVSVVGLDTAVGLMAGCGSSPRLQRLLLLALCWISSLAIAVGLAVSVTDLVRTWAR